MSLLLQPADFVERYEVPLTNLVTPKLQLYIDRYEELYLIDLLGVELYNLFKAQVVAFVVNPGIYKTLYDPIQEDDGSDIRISEGMKKMLLGFIYFHYVRDQKFDLTMSGSQVVGAETGRESGFTEFNLYGRFNESIKSYDTVQWYIQENKSVYPTYNGQYKSLVHWT